MSPRKLVAAAQLIERKGLAKGVYQDSNDRYCTVGALQHVSRTWDCFEGIVAEEIEAVLDVVEPDWRDTHNRELGYAFTFITDWNDTDTTTKEDVVLALRKAAEQ